MKSALIIFLLSIKMYERKEQNFQYHPVNKQSLLFRKPFRAN